MKQATVPWPYLMRASEKQSGLDRVRFAELLILQLPRGHNGRDTWLLNFGVGEEAQAIRKEMALPFLKEIQACPTSEAWPLRDYPSEVSGNPMEGGDR